MRRPVAREPLEGGQCVAVLFGAEAAGRWPACVRGWWPRPRVQCGLVGNVDWVVRRCAECRGWEASLFATRNVATGEELVATSSGPILGGLEREWPYEVTFDGGAREIRGRRLTGAGAIVWGPSDSDGIRAVIASCVVAIPGHHHAQYAEALGCAEAIRWLASHGGDNRSARVAGDNLSVIRYCAREGRLRRVESQAALEAALTEARARGWCIDFVAVPRRLNMDADALATKGVLLAAALADRGAMGLHVEWRNGSWE